MASISLAQRRMAAAVLLLTSASPAAADSIVLYSNDFESPNVPVTVDCGNSLDTRGINFLYGNESFVYNQQFTVEAIVIDDPGELYSDPEGTGENYALGMLSQAQDDKLALTFDRNGSQFLNIGMDLSAIDVSGCGGPFGVAQPVMTVSLLDSPGGTFAFGQTVLDSDTITGVAPPDALTFDWTYGVVSLDASGATDDFVSILFDLSQSGYAAFDNLSIVASDETGIVDTDTDGVADDADNCPLIANADQADENDNGVGDACECLGTCGDPAPDAGHITAVDAGHILRASVSLIACDLCVCDVDDGGSILSSDALADLQYAVGLPVSLTCPLVQDPAAE